ncbi:MAG TPA: hypothetical protein VKG01_16955 [Thermoanaerobaculia bacterium]|nr:hypothetical protein [Thermoanaerobaculia bacterium]
MITGYNTDVPHNKRVFHVQTEDKGDATPEIESLVYVGGEILATQRTSYAEVVESGRDDRVIQEMLERQHRTVIASIQQGRFDGPDGSVHAPDGMSAPGGEGFPAAGAGEQATAGDRTLDQVILEYLAAVMTHEQIECSFTPVPDFIAGREAAMRIRAQSSQSRQPVTGASVQVRILTTAGKGGMVFQGVTGADGGCPVTFPVPDLPEGSAAAVIRVKSPIGATEFKFPVKAKR